MAFRRKDIKKSSYYLWFLGAKESKGLRGNEFIIPVLEYLIDKEKEVEPSKVTLQVSNKGLKIIQNVPKKTSKSQSFLSLTSKTEQIKHVIPHHAITCAYQKEDIVCTILLIYNPITKCPVHVHAYRCDTVETAAALCDQLYMLIERPENQRKFEEIERRLVIKGLSENQRITRKWHSNSSNSHLHGSDGHSSRTDDGSNDSFESLHHIKETNNNHGKLNMEINSHDNPQVAILYESLAAELKAKLANPKEGPLLLPPRDYDTVSRTQGKYTALEIRNSTKKHLAGKSEQAKSDKQEIKKSEKIKVKTRSESSGKSSSGIGSDEALPSIQEIQPDYPVKFDDNSSDDERNWSPVGQREWLTDRANQQSSLLLSPTAAISRYTSIPAPVVPKSRQSSTPQIRSNTSPSPLSSSLSLHTRKQHSDTNHTDKLSKETPHYYFPDPAFMVKTAATTTGCKPENRANQYISKLKRQQSSPDYFNQLKANNLVVVKKPIALSTSLQTTVKPSTAVTGKEKTKSFNYLNTLSPEPFRLPPNNMSKKDRETNFNQRRSFIENCLQRKPNIGY